MINFRYHVVSLTAVFLALAVGLVLGAAALNGESADNSGDQVSGLRRSNAGYRGQVQHLTAEASKRDAFDREVAPRVLARTLTNRRVLLVGLPGAAATSVRGVEEMLGYAGATLTGEVALTGTFTDPTNNDALGGLATTRLPVDIHLTVPDNGDGVESASALLAAVLMTGAHPVSKDSRTTVLSAYSTGKNIVVRRAVTGPADAVIVVSGPPATDASATRRNAAALTVVRQLAAHGQTVLAAPGTSGAGNVVAAVRAERALTTRVSTVDTVSVVRGQLGAVLAVGAQLAGTVGQYGLGSGASDQLPGPAS